MPDQLHRLREGLAGRYEIERELGRGGMATVYLARDAHHDRPVALKVPPPRARRDARLRAVPARDQAGGEPPAPAHPERLRLGRRRRQLWFTMPFVEGESLRDRLTRERQLPIADALRIAREVGAARSTTRTATASSTATSSPRTSC